MKNKKQIIGHIDKIDLPELGIENLNCKIDTGADTSSIHCSHIRIVEKNGTEILKFKVLDKKHPLFSNEIFTVETFSEITIKSSNGISEPRFVIKTKAVLFGKKYNITFTLTDREKMKYPVLLGKRFLKNKFIVDVSLRDISYSHKSASK